MSIDYIALGRRIRNLRAAQGLTQDNLAYMVEVSKAHMSHIETGNTKVSLPTLVKIANSLNTTTDYLLCDSINASIPIFKQEIETIISDCSPYEYQAMISSMTNIKNIIRHTPSEKEEN